MNLTRKQFIKQVLREALEYVGKSTHESDGLAKGQMLRMIQNAQSRIAEDLMPMDLGPGNTIPYKKGCTYLFMVQHEPKFVLDDWDAADTTYHWMKRETPWLDIRVIPVVSNPADDTEVEVAVNN